MPQKASSTSKSPKSATSKATPSRAPATGADTPIQYVKGVGPRLGALFASRGLATVRDLLFFFPRAYEDRSRMLKVADLKPSLAGDGTPTVTVAVTVTGMRRIPIRGGRAMLEVRTSDDSGTLGLKWFHIPRGMEGRFVVGTPLVVTGPLKFYQNRPEIVHPEISWADAMPVSLDAALGKQPQSSGDPLFGRVVPIYVELEGISTRIFRKILWEAIQVYGDSLGEDLPAGFRERHQLPTLRSAVRAIHFPGENSASAAEPGLSPADAIAKLVEFDTPAHSRLIYEEFFKFQYLVLRQRLNLQREAAPTFARAQSDKAVSSLKTQLPFKLTGAQEEALDAILGDLALAHPMNRLIQGDVGSGKTAVAFLAAGALLAEGSQAALMAPTEILAEQHFKTAAKILKGKLNVALLTGRTPASERTPLLKRLAAGEPLLLIGTHALIEEPVKFARLSAILIDEQHRFGVEQRRALRNKGIRTEDGKTVFPHVLILTATPIPRTLALTAYGDLAISSIRELPPGRSPIITKVVKDKDQGASAYREIRTQLKMGRQAYFIYPLVNDSEAEGFEHLKSAEAQSARLQTEVFPEYRVGLLHGQQKSEEKAAIMARFVSGEIHVLVSTTVVEVGVDNPNATIMVVEHAERFGLSQLHQLRGRVGRGSHQSFCFLFSHPRVAENSQTRLEVLEETQDGFKIAEADLEIRGPGEFLGTRQAGGLTFKIANLVRDRDWLLKAREDALELLKHDPNLASEPSRPLRTYYERSGKLEFERLKTS